MAQIVIDGKQITTESNQTIIQAALQNGIDIPHFCWHPELSVSGNCRMCLVEIGNQKKLPTGALEFNESGEPVVQWFPKLQIACATPATEGMYVNTHTKKVVDSQEAVMEFLLINHPLDCPICDEAGECKLQEYAFDHSNGESRFTEAKNHKPKHVEWGPNVMYDAERCISCSRCIRYAKEIAKQDVLTFVNRGDKVTIELFEDTKFDNPYSMNVVELCPVGALTSIDFRFKSRVWEMSFTESICTGCSRGCNIKIGVRNNKVLRVQPSTNMYVNKHWLCDYGRLTQYPKLNENRILNNQIRIDGELKDSTFEVAKQFALENLKQFKSNEILLIGSPNSTNEDLFALQKFAKTVVKSSHIEIFKNTDESFGDDFLKTNDKSPNSKGAEALGYIFSDGTNLTKIKAAIDAKHIKCAIIMNEDLQNNSDIIGTLSKLEFLVVLASNHNAVSKLADVVFSLSTYAETDGSFTNFDGRVQYFTAALVTKENLHRMGMKMSRWDKFGSHNDHWTQKDERDAKPAWKIFQQLANSMSGSWNYKTAKDVFDDMASQVKPFNKMTYDNMQKHQGLKLDRGNYPDPVLVNYVSHYKKPD